MADDDEIEGLDVTGALSADERTRLFAALEADDAETAWPLFDLAESRAQEANPKGNAASLRRYWLTGEGARRIGWRRHGAFQRCVDELKGVEGSDLTNVQGYCANLYHAATGQWPGAKKGKGKVAKEATIAGSRSFSDVEELVRAALRERARTETGQSWAYVHVADLTVDQVVYAGMTGDEWRSDARRLYQRSYTIDTAGTVTLGEPSEVVRTYAPAPSEPAPESGPPGGRVTEAQPMTELGHVVEAKGKGADGGRIYRIRAINAGDSANGRRYRHEVLEAAVPLYEGARVFDGHRTDDAMRSSAVRNLIGHVESVAMGDGGVDADLHLLPTATHAAAVLDASIAAQEAGRPALAGISHDAMARFQPVQEGGRTLQDTTAITAVNSVDLVAVPAAGGRATRVLAGGEIDPQEEDVPVTKADVLAALRESSDDELSAVGLARAGTTSTTPPAPPVPVTEAAPETYPTSGLIARMMIEGAVRRASLPDAMVESVRTALPDRVTEAQVDAHVASLVAARADLERAGLVPSAPTAQVTQESLDRKIKALDATFAGNFTEGYPSFRAAWADISGARVTMWGEDVSRRIMRESFGGGFDSEERRAAESLDSTSWNVILGDSITRQLIAEYRRPMLDTWRRVVSSIVPLADFRTNRRERSGGYGTLPTVNQGAPYQPLTSPADEEVTYTIAKRGGTEDLTMEMIANDDLGAIRRIPEKLGRAAAWTLYRFVFDLITTNPTIYDSVALFDAGHANTGSTALSQSSLSVARAAMRTQAAYGDSTDILSIMPNLLLVPNELEEIAFQLTRSAVAVPSTAAGPSDTPNIHAGLGFLTLDYLTDATNWFLICDPSMCPTIEIGFYNGRDVPELFTQSEPTQGSMFTADKITYKIRLTWGGAVLEYRGMYGAIVAG